MEEFENLNLPTYKVSIFYINGDVGEFLSNDYDRAYKEFSKFFSFDVVCSLQGFIESVHFFNGKTGETRFIKFL